MPYYGGGQQQNPWQAAGAGFSTLLQSLPMIQQIEATAKIDDALKASGGDPGAAYGSMVESGYGSQAGPLATQAQQAQQHRGRMQQMDAETSLRTRQEAASRSGQLQDLHKTAAGLAVGVPNDEALDRVRGFYRDSNFGKFAEKIDGTFIEGLKNGRVVNDAQALKAAATGTEGMRTAMRRTLEDPQADDADLDHWLDMSEAWGYFSPETRHVARQIAARNPGEMTDDERKDLVQLLGSAPPGDAPDLDQQFANVVAQGGEQGPILDAMRAQEEATAGYPASPAEGIARATATGQPTAPWARAAGVLEGAEAQAREAAKPAEAAAADGVTPSSFLFHQPVNESVRYIDSLPGTEKAKAVNGLVENINRQPNKAAAWAKVTDIVGSLGTSLNDDQSFRLLHSYAEGLSGRATERDKAVEQLGRAIENGVLNPNHADLARRLIEEPAAATAILSTAGAAPAPAPGDPTPAATSASVSYAPSPVGLGQSAPKAQFTTGRGTFDSGDPTDYLDSVVNRR